MRLSREVNRAADELERTLNHEEVPRPVRDAAQELISELRRFDRTTIEFPDEPEAECFRLMKNARRR